MMAMIDKAGRIVVPKDVREQLNFTANTELELTVEGDSLRIRPAARPARTLQLVEGFPVFAATDSGALGDLDVQRLKDADQR